MNAKAVAIKAITVQQPWCWAIIHGGKDIENRKQLWNYRGPLAIHAGLTWSHNGGRSGILRGVWQDQNPGYRGGRLPMHRFVGGAIIGLVDLVDVHSAHPGCCTSVWAERFAGLTHLVLESPRALIEPIPCRGALGLWTPTPDVIEQLKAATNA